VQKVRAAAARTQCQNNLHQMGVALHNYVSDYHKFPSGSHSIYDQYWYWSWMAKILPYMEQSNVYYQAQAFASTNNNPWAPNPALGETQVNYVCPSDPRGQAVSVVNNPNYAAYSGVNGPIAFTEYKGNSGTNGGSGSYGSGSTPVTSGPTLDGVLYVDSQVRFSDITDGSSNTLLVGEQPCSEDFNFGWWFAGWGYNGSGTGDVVLGSREIYMLGSGYLQNYDLSTGTTSAPNPACSVAQVGLQQPVGQVGQYASPCDMQHFWSFHSGGCNFLFADASVHFLPYAANNILPALATRNGGESFTPDW
jgi:prepilin-type processing-associated H-X9-DG protein